MQILTINLAMKLLLTDKKMSPIEISFKDENYK